MLDLNWDDSMLVGVSDLDQQHQGLFKVVQEMVGALGFDGQDQIALNVLAKMETYTREHFAFEERLMADVEYPDIAAHRDEHRTFVDNVVAYKQSAKKGHVPVTEVVDFLANWLVEHIKGTDQEFCVFYQSNR